MGKFQKDNKQKEKGSWKVKLGFIGVTILVIVAFMLLPDSTIQKKCRYDDACVPWSGGIAGTPCCSEVGLTKNISWPEINMMPDCCYPADCPQAENNPDTCECVYMIECLTDEEYEEIFFPDDCTDIIANVSEECLQQEENCQSKELQKARKYNNCWYAKFQREVRGVE